jgi:hypothetical protein
MVLVIVALAATVSSAAGAKAKQTTFSSPEEAVGALVDAVKSADEKKLLAIFGPGSRWLIFSGDRVDDRRRRDGFLNAYEEINKLEEKGPATMILHVGKQDHPFAIPIVKKGNMWAFDTKAGKEEMLNRRIGRNELNAIDVVRQYVLAQREYVSKDRDGDGVLEFAQRLASTPGNKDGLYWKAKEGGEESPFGPLAAKASGEGYGGKAKKDKPLPYHGYVFRILTSQGKNATGGEYDYVVKGDMILGFAIVAYPAKYNSSGIMTFIVNQEGVVYQKDLGRQTAKVAGAMTRFDPDKTWTKVEDKPAP